MVVKEEVSVELVDDVEEGLEEEGVLALVEAGDKGLQVLLLLETAHYFGVEQDLFMDALPAKGDHGGTDCQEHQVVIGQQFWGVEGGQAVQQQLSPFVQFPHLQ